MEKKTKLNILKEDKPATLLEDHYTEKTTEQPNYLTVKAIRKKKRERKHGDSLVLVEKHSQV